MMLHKRAVAAILLRGLILLLVLGGPVARAAHPSASMAATAPTFGPYAVFQSGGIGQVRSYSIYLVDRRGHIVARATPHAPSCCAGGPDYLPPGAAATRCCVLPGALIVWPNVVSASRTRLYYLDGDSTVRYLLPTGATGIATHVPGGPATLIGFAVSPDDQRIAVAVRTYPPLAGHHNYVDSDTQLRLYVEDLGSGAHHRDIFATTAKNPDSEWPVGWYHGKLLLALGPVGTQSPFWTNPYYAAGGYHLVDAATGTRLASICATPAGTGAKVRQPSGPLSPDGTACAPDNAIGTQGATAATLFIGHWDGSCSTFSADARRYSAEALSPTGDAIAATKTSTNSSGSQTSTGIVVLHAGGTATVPGTGHLTPWGWLDAAHLIVGQDYFAGKKPAIVDAHTGTSVAISLPGATWGAASFKGILPTNLDATGNAGTATQSCPA